MIHIGLPGGRCKLCGTAIDNASRGRECPGVGDRLNLDKEPVTPKHMIEVEKVEAIFDAWCDELVRHHGDRTVAAVLSSPAIQSAFTGDVGQSSVESG